MILLLLSIESFVNIFLWINFTRMTDKNVDLNLYSH